MGERDSLLPPSDLDPPSDLTRYADYADNDEDPRAGESDKPPSTPPIDDDDDPLAAFLPKDPS